MPFVTSEIPDNPDLRAIGHDYLEAGWGDYLSTVAAEALHYSPTSSLARMNELSLASGNVPVTMDSFGFSPPHETAPEPQAKFLSSDEWAKSLYYRKGLSFPDGVSEPVAEILSRRYDERAHREDVISRAPKSFAKYPAALATSLAASLLDPLNVASAFVPIVSEARYARMLARLGKFGARAAKGAIEGAAGQALIEPVIAGAAASDPTEDYRMADALSNIAFGGLFGGGLHVATGAVGDLLSRFSPGAREKLLRTAVGQVADAKTVDVEPLARVAEMTELTPKPLPALGDTIEFVRDGEPVRGEVTGFETHPITGETLPVVHFLGKDRPVFEWGNDAEVVSSGASEGASPRSAEHAPAVSQAEASRAFEDIRRTGINPEGVRAAYGEDAVLELNRKYPGLIREGGKPLADVAEEHGFSDPLDFYHALVNYGHPLSVESAAGDAELFSRIGREEPDASLRDEVPVAVERNVQGISGQVDELEALRSEVESYSARIEQMKESGLLDDTRASILREAEGRAAETEALADALDRVSPCIAMKGSF